MTQATAQMAQGPALLHGLRVLDVSFLGAGALAQQLADLGADVVKVEPPYGDHVRLSGAPIVEGSSLLHWHFNRGKRSIVLDLTTPSDIGRFLDLVGKAEVLIEGMRPGGLDRRGLNWERLLQANPRLVMCSISGFGSIGPLKDLGMHGMGFDAWASILAPDEDTEGNPVFPEKIATVGSCVGPVWGALGVLAAVLRARGTGSPCRLDISQAGAAAASQSLPLEATRYMLREGDQVSATSGKTLKASVRYNFYRTRDGVILVMMTERKFWRNFCVGLDRLDLYERWPGAGDPEHDHGNEPLRAELRQIFSSRSSAEWIRLGVASNFPITQAHDKRTLLEDPHFEASMEWIPRDAHPMAMLAIPIRMDDERPLHLRRAPDVGEHTAEVLDEWLSSEGGTEP